MNLESKIEAILFFRNETVKVSELCKTLGESAPAVETALENIKNEFREKGVVLVREGENVCFGTNPSLSSLIETIQKEELSRELGSAGLETLSIILYKGPISRREIDYIRGVNSTYILRNLLIRDLIDRYEGGESNRGYTYKPTIKLLRYLGVASREDLPDFKEAMIKIDGFEKSFSEPQESEEEYNG